MGVPVQTQVSSIFPITYGGFTSFIDAALNFKSTSTGEEKFYITLLPNSESVSTGNPLDSIIRTTQTGSFKDSSGSFAPGDLRELSTFEIMYLAIGSDNENYLALNYLKPPRDGYRSRHETGNSLSWPTNAPQLESYFGYNDFGGEPIPKFNSGSYLISKMNDKTPSLLVELDKPSSVPDDIGSKPYIAIPHNLHPFIKDNLLYFVSQAGIDVGDIKTPKLNRTKQNLS